MHWACALAGAEHVPPIPCSRVVRQYRFNGHGRSFGGRLIDLDSRAQCTGLVRSQGRNMFRQFPARVSSANIALMVMVVRSGVVSLI
jgi:hypothetical protein